MEYRTNKRTGDKISALGFGTAYVADGGEKAAIETIKKAYGGGINYYDLATASAATFNYFRKALSDVRKNVFYQIHFGADYSSGEYGYSTDVEKIKRGVEWQLNSLATDYIDYGFIHCIDELADWDAYKKGALHYLLDMKDQGVVKHIGLSSHTPATIEKVLDEVPVDQLMFSINPAYDHQQGEFARGTLDERAKLYQRCETDSIGITVMKPFSGGQLLDAAISPFGQALSQYQCLQYALDTPGVISVLPGFSNVQQLEYSLAFFNAPEAEKDYGILRTFCPPDTAGKCVYCNHCKPCPQGLDIGRVNKYYDLALNGDTLAVSHYQRLTIRADSCVACGHCNSRCPFGVDQVARMEEIAGYFEKVLQN